MSPATHQNQEAEHDQHKRRIHGQGHNPKNDASDALAQAHCPTVNTYHSAPS